LAFFFLLIKFYLFVFQLYSVPNVTQAIQSSSKSHRGLKLDDLDIVFEILKENNEADNSTVDIKHQNYIRKYGKPMKSTDMIKIDNDDDFLDVKKKDKKNMKVEDIEVKIKLVEKNVFELKKEKKKERRKKKGTRWLVLVVQLKVTSIHQNKKK
jgi:hypothetical protein